MPRALAELGFMIFVPPSLHSKMGADVVVSEFFCSSDHCGSGFVCAREYPNEGRGGFPRPWRVYFPLTQQRNKKGFSLALLEGLGAA